MSLFCQQNLFNFVLLLFSYHNTCRNNFQPIMTFHLVHVYLLNSIEFVKFSKIRYIILDVVLTKTWLNGVVFNLINYSTIFDFMPILFYFI